MTISKITRNSGRLSSLEFLIAAQAKLAQADSVLKLADSVHGSSALRLDELAVAAVRNHVGLALQAIADLRRSRNCGPPNPFSRFTPQVIASGHVLFQTETHHE